MIVRLMGEGQFELDQAACDTLNEIDDAAVSALESDDEETFRARLRELAQTVRDKGDRLPDENLRPSEVIVPPADLSLEEARELFSGEGLIPDIPSA